MKRRTLVVIVTGGAAVALTAGIVAALNADRRPDNASVGIRSTQDPSAVASYWTPERMRNAKGG